MKGSIAIAAASATIASAAATPAKIEARASGSASSSGGSSGSSSGSVPQVSVKGNGMEAHVNAVGRGARLTLFSFLRR